MRSGAGCGSGLFLHAVAGALLFSSIPAQAKDPPPVDFFVLLDSSGSMRDSDGNRVTLLSTLLMGTLIGADDRLFIAHHASGETGSGVTWPLNRKPTLSALRRALNRLGQYGDGTDCASGLQRTMEAMRAAASPGRKQVALILGDADCDGRAGGKVTYEMALPPFVEDLDQRAGPGEVPVVFVALSPEARTAYTSVEQLAKTRFRNILPVYLPSSDPFVSSPSGFTLMSAFAEALRKGAGFSEAVEARPGVSGLDGCMANQKTQLLLLGDTTVEGWTITGRNTDGSAADPGAVTASRKTNDTYQFQRRQKYRYEIWHVESSAAQIHIEVKPATGVKPADVRWRGLFVPIFDDSVSQGRSLQVAPSSGGSCQNPQWFGSNPPAQPVDSTFCFQTQLTGRCDERDPRVVITDAATGIAVHNAKLDRQGKGGTFAGAAQGWRCPKGRFLARVVVDPPRGGRGVVDLTPDVEFECNACALESPVNADGVVSWCEEEAQRTMLISAALQAVCPAGMSVAVPELQGPHRHCFSVSAGPADPKRPVVELRFVFDPFAPGCDLAPGGPALDIPLLIPAATPAAPGHLKVTIENPYELLAIVGAPDGATADYDRCPAAGNFAHLALHNASQCTLRVAGVALTMQRTDGGEPEAIPVEPSGDLGKALLNLMPPHTIVKPGEKLPLAELRTTESYCDLDGTYAYRATVYPLRAHPGHRLSGRLDLAQAPWSDGWWLCTWERIKYWLLLAAAVLGGLILLIWTFGYPGERTQLSLHRIAGTSDAIEKLDHPTDPRYPAQPRNRNWNFRRWVSGVTRYGWYVVPHGYEQGLTFRFTDKLCKRKKGSTSVEPYNTYTNLLAPDGSGDVRFGAELRWGSGPDTTRARVAERVGRPLDCMRWLVYGLALLLLAAGLYAWIRVSGICG